MHDRTDHELRRPPDIDPETIHAAIREAHRLRAQTARELFTAAAAGIGRACRALREVFAHAPAQRAAPQIRTTK
jgi:hypothetical protein